MRVGGNALLGLSARGEFDPECSGKPERPESRSARKARKVGKPGTT
jgi:hypothetical protein